MKLQVNVVIIEDNILLSMHIGHEMETTGRVKYVLSNS